MGKKQDKQTWINIAFLVLILILLADRLNVVGFAWVTDAHGTFGHTWQEVGPFTQAVMSDDGKFRIGENNQMGNARFAVLNGPVGIGTVDSTQALDINGGIRIRGGNPQKDKVLTAVDNLGNAVWDDPPSAPSCELMGSTTIAGETIVVDVPSKCIDKLCELRMVVLHPTVSDAITGYFTQRSTNNRWRAFNWIIPYPPLGDAPITARNYWDINGGGASTQGVILQFPNAPLATWHPLILEGKIGVEQDPDKIVLINDGANVRTDFYVCD